MLLHAAAAIGDIATIQDLLDEGYDINEIDLDDESEYNMFTPLLVACDNGQVSTAEFIILHGGDITCTDEYGGNALFLAARAGGTDVVELLLRYDKDIDHMTRFGWTALCVATCLPDVVKVLIENGAAVDLVVHDEDRTPLGMAVSYNEIEVAKMILQVSANPDLTGFDKMTPLHIACQYGSLEMVQLLIDRCDLTLKQRDGLTPYQVAMANGHGHIARYLKRATMGVVASHTNSNRSWWLPSFMKSESNALKHKETIWGCSLLAPLYSIRSLTSLAAVSNEIVLTPRSSEIIPADMQLIFIYSGVLTATVLDLGTVTFNIERGKRYARKRSNAGLDESLASRLRMYAIDREHFTEEVMLSRRGAQAPGSSTYLLRFVASKIRSNEVVVKSLIVTNVQIKAKTKAITLPPIVPSHPKGTTWGRFNAVVPISPRRISTQATVANISLATAPTEGGNVPITEDCAKILGRSPYFADIGHIDLRHLADLGTVSIVQEETSVMHEREDGGYEMFVVLSGDLRVCVRDPATRVLKPIAKLHSGSCMGEMTLLMRGPRTATVTTITDCLLVSIERSALMSFLRRQPKVEASLKRTLIERLLQIVIEKKTVPFFDAIDYDHIKSLVPHCFIEDHIPRGTVLHPQPEEASKLFRIVLTGTVEIIDTKESTSVFIQSGHVGELIPELYPISPTTRIVASTECSFIAMAPDTCIVNLGAISISNALIRMHQENSSVDWILKNPTARQFYLRYLTSEFSEENLLFVIAVQAFKLSPNIIQDAEAISFEYILESAPKQVNVDSKMREEIIEMLPNLGKSDENDHTIFDKAVDEITKLMRKDSFPRFKRTAFFQDMLAAFPMLDHQSHDPDTSNEHEEEDAPLTAMDKRFKNVLDQVFEHRENRRGLTRGPSLTQLGGSSHNHSKVSARNITQQQSTRSAVSCRER